MHLSISSQIQPETSVIAYSDALYMTMGLSIKIPFLPNHGSTKLVPAILGSFHLGWFSTSIIMGGRVIQSTVSFSVLASFEISVFKWPVPELIIATPKGPTAQQVPRQSRVRCLINGGGQQKNNREKNTEIYCWFSHSMSSNCYYLSTTFNHQKEISVCVIAWLATFDVFFRMVEILLRNHWCQSFFVPCPLPPVWSYAKNTPSPSADQVGRK